MQRLDLKLQNDFATRYSSKVVNQPLSQTNITKMSGESVFPVQNVGKTPGSMEYASRIFSPYLTPSAIHTENRQISQGSVCSQGCFCPRKRKTARTQICTQYFHTGRSGCTPIARWALLLSRRGLQKATQDGEWTL